MYTNKTEYFEFPQYVTTDIPTILEDMNGFFEKLDAILHTMSEGNTGVTDAITELRADADELINKVATLETKVSTLETSVSGIDTQINDSSTGIIKQISDITNTLTSFNQRITALES